MIKPQMPITTPSQFPTFLEATSPAMKAIKLSAGLGVVTFDGPFGRAFFKGGHNDTTGNQAICVEKGRRCVLFLSNDVRAESLYPAPHRGDARRSRHALVVGGLHAVRQGALRVRGARCPVHRRTLLSRYRPLQRNTAGARERNVGYRARSTGTTIALCSGLQRSAH